LLLEVTSKLDATPAGSLRHENSLGNTKEVKNQTENTTHYNASTYIWLAIESVSTSDATQPNLLVK